MGTWLILLSKEIVLVFLLLSYAFGNHYNKRYLELMNSLGYTLYDFPTNSNVRQRQTRDAQIANKHTKEQNATRREYENSLGTGNKAYSRVPCSTRRKRSSERFREVSGDLFNFPKKTFRSNESCVKSYDVQTNKRTFQSNILGRMSSRKKRSVFLAPYNVPSHPAQHSAATDDLLNSIGGDLMRIESEIIKSNVKEKKQPVVASKGTITRRTNDNNDDSSIKDNDKNYIKSDVSNSNILQNAFHHIGSKNHVLHAKREQAGIDGNKDKGIYDLGQPGLLSFFKDEGEPALSLANDTDGDRDDNDDDPFQGTILKADASPILKQLIHGNFDEFDNDTKDKKNIINVASDKNDVKKASSIPTISKENITRNTISKPDSGSISNSSASPNASGNNVKAKSSIDFTTGTGISIKSIFANAVQTAVQNAVNTAEQSAVQNAVHSAARNAVQNAVKADIHHGVENAVNKDIIGRLKSLSPASNLATSNTSKPQRQTNLDNLDPVEKFLNESNSFNALINQADDIPAEKTKDAPPQKPIESNEKLKMNLKNNIVEKQREIDDYISKITSDPSVEPSPDDQEATAEAIEIISSKRTNKAGGGNQFNKLFKENKKDAGPVHKSKIDLLLKHSVSDYIVNNDMLSGKSNISNLKDPIISPIGEDYIESGDVLPTKSGIINSKHLLGDEYVETSEYLSSKSMLPLDDLSMRKEKYLPDDEKVHSILRDKDAIRSNYIHEHKDVNKEILELIQSYYKTGGRKHLKDIYRDSKINEANRNRIEFFNAMDKELIGAVCMDGSNPGYYLRKGYDTGADKWIIHLHGGAWCYNLQTCYKRRNTILGSTKGYSREDISKFFHGILSKSSGENPHFFKWNIAVLSYCDGGLFSGNRKMFLMGKGKKFYFRGRRVLRLLMENLRRQQSLHKAKEVILSGTSAGGLALILQGDYIRKFIPKNTKVRGLADAAFFLDQKRSSHGNHQTHKQFKALYELHRPVLKKKCVDSYPKKDRYLCLFPQNTIHFVKLPLFIVNSLYDHWQLSYLEGVNCIYENHDCKTAQRDHILNFRNRMYSTLSDVRTFKNNTGVFANSCIAHGQVILDYTWARSKINNKSIADSFISWYEDGEQGNSSNVNHFHADCKYPCNGSCPRTLAKSCVENFKGVSSRQRYKNSNLC